MQSGRKRPERKPRSIGFTLIELLVVVAIIALLISILLPSLSRARRQSMVVNCQSNLKQIVQATFMYAEESEGRFPYAAYFISLDRRVDPNLQRFNAPFIQDALIPYLGGDRRADFVDANTLKAVAFSKVFRCPDVERFGSNDPNTLYLRQGVANHYRYNVNGAIDPSVCKGKVLTQTRYPDRAVLHYDVVFADWKKGMFPHAASTPFINVAYVSGAVARVTHQEYIDLSPWRTNLINNEGRNPFLRNGWTVFNHDPNLPLAYP